MFSFSKSPNRLHIIVEKPRSRRSYFESYRCCGVSRTSFIDIHKRCMVSDNADAREAPFSGGRLEKFLFAKKKTPKPFIDLLLG